MSLKEIQEVALEEHNIIRKSHNLPDLKGDVTTQNDAQKHANYLVNTNRFEPTNDAKYGCNVSMSFKSDMKEAVRNAVKLQYEKKSHYNYLTPEISLLGVGIGRNRENKWVIVMFYAKQA